MVLGSVAVEVAEHGPGPIVVVRPPSAGHPASGPVVVGLDGSDHSTTALALAFEEASLRGVDLVAVRTWEEYGYGRVPPIGLDGQDRLDEETRGLAEQLAGWEEKYPDVVVHRRLLRGRAAEMLDWVGRRWHAGMICVGSRGRGAVAGLLLGSTSRHLLGVSHQPVAVVHERG